MFFNYIIEELINPSVVNVLANLTHLHYTTLYFYEPLESKFSFL